MNVCNSLYIHSDGVSSDTSSVCRQQDMQCMCNVNSKHVRVTTVAVEKQYYIF